MEKLVYLLDRAVDDPENQAFLDSFKAGLLPVIRASGGHHITLNIADIDALVVAANSARIAGEWKKVGAVVAFWLDTLDSRADIEAAIETLSPGYSGYLVTESIPQAFEVEWGEGERRPGVTQFTAHNKPDSVSEAEFYHNWQVKHSAISFDLHPLRWSYVRNAVARPLTQIAPAYRAIVLEHFRELRDFTDDSRYFGDPEVVEEMYADLPGFCDFNSMITGPMSEYWFD
ncbi:EthD domain-containing protein [Parahaliea mediterranea]|uniref:EthD domain-containing protein n=1 Tax=Parahaliea mediterranea TaxID=651086 RepID=UPI000E2F6C95|nr:EthD domain-containing protein [Parahaliea mediterranea]